MGHQKTITRSRLAYVLLPVIAFGTLAAIYAAQPPSPQPDGAAAEAKPTDFSKIAGFRSNRPATTAKEYLHAYNLSPRAILSADLPPEEVAIVAKELRERFPFESMVERLAYEREHFGEAKPAPKPVSKIDLGEYGSTRASSLEKIHAEEVEGFINRSGFGLSRMSKPSPDQLFVPDRTGIPLATVPVPVGIANEPTVAIPAGNKRVYRQVGLTTVPTVRSLEHHWRKSVFYFTYPGSEAYIKDREHVAGFVPHGIPVAVDKIAPLVKPLPPRPIPNGKALTKNPPKSLTPKPPEPNWQTANLELVSLLKHDEPAVYVSDNLPAMSELVNAELRALNEFESDAVSQLKKGEEVVHHATTNRIQMVGAIRAGKSCAECHFAPEGTLLGAFTYEFVRVPQVEVGKVDGLHPCVENTAS